MGNYPLVRGVKARETVADADLVDERTSYSFHVAYAIDQETSTIRQ
jgi:hypothetical protein